MQLTECSDSLLRDAQPDSGSKILQVHKPSVPTLNEHPSPSDVFLTSILTQPETIFLPALRRSHSSVLSGTCKRLPGSRRITSRDIISNEIVFITVFADEDLYMQTINLLKQKIV